MTWGKLTGQQNAVVARTLNVRRRDNESDISLNTGFKSSRRRSPVYSGPATPRGDVTLRCRDTPLTFPTAPLALSTPNIRRRPYVDSAVP